MTLYNTLVENLNEKFTEAKVNGTGPLAPRPGYFFIREVGYKTTKMQGEAPIG